MAHDVFISYSSKDKPIADGICASLEASGIRCWIAPRDIAAGEDWPAAILRAISHSRVMVLVFSANSNASEDVGREIMLAANSKLVIIPFKIGNVEPEPGKQYYLARTHWLDAINPPTREQIRTLIRAVGALIPPAGLEGAGEPAGRKEPPPAQPVRAGRPSALRFLWIPVALAVLGTLAWILTGAGPALAPVRETVAESPASASTFRDDFSNEGVGWEVSTNPVAEKYYSKGEYILHILPGYTSNFSNAWSTIALDDLTNAVVEFDARWLGGEGAYGVIFNYKGEEQFAFVEVTPDGYWDAVQKTGGYFTDLVSFTPASAINTGTSVNHLRIELTDSPAFYINGEFVARVDIPNLAGHIGFWATGRSGSEFKVAFDNLVVTRLP